MEPYFKGMTFHLDSSGRNYLPILPRGDPKAPRPPPLHSVMDLKDPKAAPPTTSSKLGGLKYLKDPKAPTPSPKSQKDPESSRTKRHNIFPGSGSNGVMAPRHLPPGPSSSKARGISSTTSVKRLVELIALTSSKNLRVLICRCGWPKCSINCPFFKYQGTFWILLFQEPNPTQNNLNLKC